MGKTGAKFVTLEGGDGAGKSTLLGKIERFLSAQNQRFIKTREPGGTPVAEQIREIILQPGQLTAAAELFLYEAARAEHVERVIRPALTAGVHVLCDRFTTSTLAYQAHARGLGVEWVERLNQAATQGLEPDAVIWLNLTPEEARKRMQARGQENRMDAEAFSFHQAVHQGFAAEAARTPERFIVLDASKSPEEIFDQLIAHPLWKNFFGAT